MKSPNIKKDVEFVIKSLNNENNQINHFPALRRLINNFIKKWDDLMGPGNIGYYINRLNKEYQNGLQHCKRNERQNHR